MKINQTFYVENKVGTTTTTARSAQISIKGMLTVLLSVGAALGTRILALLVKLPTEGGICAFKKISDTASLQTPFGKPLALRARLAVPSFPPASANQVRN